jgi:hypothetical protein
MAEAPLVISLPREPVARFWIKQGGLRVSQRPPGEETRNRSCLFATRATAWNPNQGAISESQANEISHDAQVMSLSRPASITLTRDGDTLPLYSEP